MRLFKFCLLLGLTVGIHSNGLASTSNCPKQLGMIDFNQIRKNLHQKIQSQLQGVMRESELDLQQSADTLFAPYGGLSLESMELIRKRIDERDALNLILSNQAG